MCGPACGTKKVTHRCGLTAGGNRSIGMFRKNGPIEEDMEVGHVCLDRACIQAPTPAVGGPFGQHDAPIRGAAEQHIRGAERASQAWEMAHAGSRFHWRTRTTSGSRAGAPNDRWARKECHGHRECCPLRRAGENAPWSLRARDSNRCLANVAGVGLATGFTTDALGFRRDFADIALPMRGFCTNRTISGWRWPATWPVK